MCGVDLTRLWADLTTSTTAWEWNHWCVYVWVTGTGTGRSIGTLLKCNILTSKNKRQPCLTLKMSVLTAAQQFAVSAQGGESIHLQFFLIIPKYLHHPSLFQSQVLSFLIFSIVIFIGCKQWTYISHPGHQSGFFFSIFAADRWYKWISLCRKEVQRSYMTLGNL